MAPRSMMAVRLLMRTDAAHGVDSVTFSPTSANLNCALSEEYKVKWQKWSSATLQTKM